MGKTMPVELAFLHNHIYFVMGILDMRGLVSVALILFLTYMQKSSSSLYVKMLFVTLFNLLIIILF